MASLDIKGPTTSGWALLLNHDIRDSKMKKARSLKTSPLMLVLLSVIFGPSSSFCGRTPDLPDRFRGGPMWRVPGLGRELLRC